MWMKVKPTSLAVQPDEWTSDAFFQEAKCAAAQGLDKVATSLPLCGDL